MAKQVDAGDQVDGAESTARLWLFTANETVPYDLGAGPLTIGRAESNTIQLDDPLVSRAHARVVRDGHGYRIEDLNSVNGTFLNGSRITASRLEIGARIKIGRAELVLDDGLEVDEGGSHEDVSKSIIATLDVIPPARQTAGGGAQRAEDPAAKKLRLNQLIGEKLIQVLDTEQLASEILLIVIEQTKADRGFVCLFDEAGNNVPLASYGLGTGERMKISRMVIRRLREQKTGVLIKHVPQDDPRLDSLNAMSVVSMVCVPLWISDRIMGFLSLDSLTPEREFTEEHLDLLMAIAHQAAIGIERSRLAKLAAEEQHVRSYLGQYLDAKILQQITDRGDRQDPLAPTVRELTVLFSDIVSFTKISEGLEPNELKEFVHEYLTAMTEIIFAHGGTIDKYIGDAVMALFGAPITHPQSAAHAVRAGLAMRERVQQMSAPRGAARLRTRIGISTGPAVVGNLGSAQRTEYTAIGDSVNVAARLEGFARPNEVCIDEGTFQHCGDTFAVQEIGTVDVKNRQMPIEVYKVLGEIGDNGDEDTATPQEVSGSMEADIEPLQREIKPSLP